MKKLVWLSALAFSSLLLLNGCSTGAAGGASSKALPANGCFLHVQGLKLILAYRDRFGTWPKSSKDLTEHGILPAKLAGAPPGDQSRTVDETSFRVLSASDKDGVASIRFSIGEATFTDINSLEALQTLK
jgi:hypothetical protein